MEDYDNLFLIHYGVKGMKWGKRKKQLKLHKKIQHEDDSESLTHFGIKGMRWGYHKRSDGGWEDNARGKKDADAVKKYNEGNARRVRATKKKKMREEMEKIEQELKIATNKKQVAKLKAKLAALRKRDSENFSDKISDNLKNLNSSKDLMDKVLEAKKIQNDPYREINFLDKEPKKKTPTEEAYDALLKLQQKKLAEINKKEAKNDAREKSRMYKMASNATDGDSKKKKKNRSDWKKSVSSPWND